MYRKQQQHEHSVGVRNIVTLSCVEQHVFE